MRICLFEEGAEGLAPLSWTRPVFELLCGATSLAAKQRGHFLGSSAGALVRPYLADLYRVQYPGLPVNNADWLQSEATVLVNGRWLPPPSVCTSLSFPCLGMVNDEVAYAAVGPELLRNVTADSLPDALHRWQRALPCTQAGGKLISFPWELVEENAEQLGHDFEDLRASGMAAWHPETLTAVGPRERVCIHPSARIDPFVVADTTGGPVTVARDAVVASFTRLEGPCHVGPGTHILGAHIRAGSTLGPHCRIGGEVEASIVHGCSNKYHDGFLGHAYLGEWVNLGAGTSNSDLRNDYRPVSMVVDGQAVCTGLTKVGCFLGDHTKTGLGTLLNTGTNAGIFCNLLPSSRFVPRCVPSFSSWWDGRLRDNDDWPTLMATARTVMQRRGFSLTAEHEAVYRHLFEASAAERRRAQHDAEQRRLRRSA